MASPPATHSGRRRSHSQAGVAITVVAWLMGLWCIGFAVANIIFETTGYFADGPYADYAAGFSVMNWFVVVLKLLAAAVALLTVASPSRFVPPVVLAAGVWGVFATLAVYVLGSLVEAIAMVSGLAGSPDQIDLAGVGYVLFFLSAAAGYGLLAVSYSRRLALGWRVATLGVLAAPLVLGLVLLAMPALLAALGILPSP